jgi:glucose-1-phosphatase
MIKTVIFDLGGVIVPFDFSRAYARMEKLCGLPQPEIRDRIVQANLPVRLESGQMAAAPFVEELGAVLGCTLDLDEFRELWCSIFYKPTLIPESLLESIKAERRLLLLSNTNSIHFEMIQANYGLLRHFDHFVLSYEVGAMKPSHLIYQEAIRQAGCRPEECFYTDDVAEFVEGARREGIDAVQFQNAGQLCDALAERGIATR